MGSRPEDWRPEVGTHQPRGESWVCVHLDDLGDIFLDLSEPHCLPLVKGIYCLSALAGRCESRKKLESSGKAHGLLSKKGPRLHLPPLCLLGRPFGLSEATPYQPECWELPK